MCPPNARSYAPGPVTFNSIHDPRRPAADLARFGGGRAARYPPGRNLRIRVAESDEPRNTRSVHSHARASLEEFMSRTLVMLLLVAVGVVLLLLLNSAEPERGVPEQVDEAGHFHFTSPTVLPDASAG